MKTRRKKKKKKKKIKRKRNKISKWQSRQRELLKKTFLQADFVFID